MNLVYSTMKQEQWINEVLESTAGKSEAIPDAGLFAKIQYKIQTENIPMRWIWMAAASLLLLVALNVTIMFSNRPHGKTAVETIAKDLSQSNQLY